MKTNLLIGVAALGAAGACCGAIAGPQPLQTTSIQGLSVFTAPPGNFNALLATPQVRASYGLPPAPDATGQPAAYNAWARAVGSILKYQPGGVTANFNLNPPMVVPNSKHGVASPTYSPAWSGTAVTAPLGTFQAESIQATLSVTSPKPAPGSCTTAAGAPPAPGPAATSAISQWVGLDGVNSPDVLQAGIATGVQCANGSPHVTYQPWIEWYPATSIAVNSPQISAGDLVQIVVWSVSPTTGNASIIDLTSGVSSSYQITAPTGIALLGNSVDWVTENPLVNGSLGLFASYTTATWSGAVAWNYNSASPTYLYAGNPQVPYTASFLTISMLDGNGNAISAPIMMNQDVLIFESY